VSRRVSELCRPVCCFGPDARSIWTSRRVSCILLTFTHMHINMRVHISFNMRGDLMRHKSLVACVIVSLAVLAQSAPALGQPQHGGQSVTVIREGVRITPGAPQATTKRHAAGTPSGSEEGLVDVAKETPEELMHRAHLARRLQENSNVKAAAADAFTACQAEIHGGKTGGYVISHHRFCQYLGVHAYREACRDGVCQTIATADFRFTVIGYTEIGQRSVNFGLKLDSWKLWGSIADMVLTIGVTCRSDSAGYSCTPGSSGATLTIGQWMVAPNRTYTFSGLAGSATGDEKRTFLSFDYHFKGGPLDHVIRANWFRCDSATYVDYNNGCVFHAVEEIFYFERDSANSQAADHIRDATLNPNITIPPPAPGESKRIPGSIYTGNTIGRIRPGSPQIGANRNKAIATCKIYWGPDYAKGGDECDEFPFATTWEGAASPYNDFSVSAISGGHNRAGGIAVNRFYGVQRILGGDTFYVVIV